MTTYFSYLLKFRTDLSLPANADLFDIIGRTPESDDLFRGSVKLRVLVKLVRRFIKVRISYLFTTYFKLAFLPYVSNQMYFSVCP